MKENYLIRGLMYYGLLALIFQSCGPNAVQIAKQMEQDSIRRVDSLTTIHKLLFEKQQQDSIATIKEKELKGETIWANNKLGYFIDIRDNKRYKVVKIGNQTIMAENIAYKPANGNYWSFNNDQANVQKYGYLYDWETANAIAPKGWHLPTRVEVDTLFTYINRVYKKQSFDAIIKGGSSGFDAIFGGNRTDGIFENNGYVQFWTSHKSIIYTDAFFVLIFGLNANEKTFIGDNSISKNGHYVRLIKD